MPPTFPSAFFKGPKKIIEDNLALISRCLVTHNLFKLLRKQPSVKAAIKSPSRSRSKKVDNIIAISCEKIAALPPVDLTIRLNIESHDKALEIIMSTIVALHKLEGLDPDQVDDGRNEALQRDQDEFNSALNYKPFPSSQTIRLIDMDTQTLLDDQPVDRWKTYGEIMLYLSNMHGIQAPDLWVTQKRMHSLTVEGTQWFYRSATDKVEQVNTDIYFLGTSNRQLYVVALLERLDEGSEEVPMALDIAKFGTGATCTSLGEYLRHACSQLEIIEAGRIGEFNTRSSLGDVLDTSNFKPLTHELWIQCRNRQNVTIDDDSTLENSERNSAQLQSSSGISGTPRLLEPQVALAAQEEPLSLSLSALMEISELKCLTGEVEFNRNTPVAHGGFATVYKGIWGTKLVAVKELKINRNLKIPNLEKTMGRRSRREMTIWAALKHPNIVSLYGYTMEEHNPFPAMISEWCEYGDASEYFGDSSNEASKSRHERFRLAREVADGLAYMHSLQLVHGDIKPSNVLISAEGVARLCDFGLVRLIECQVPPGMTTTTPYGGTIRYKAPELFLRGGKRNQKLSNSQSPNPTFASDVYALGCVIYEEAIIYESPRFVSSNPPYCDWDDDIVVIAQAIRDGEPPAERPTNIGDEAGLWDLLEGSWNSNPDERPVIERVVERLRDIQPAFLSPHMHMIDN